MRLLRHTAPSLLSCSLACECRCQRLDQSLQFVFLPGTRSPLSMSGLSYVVNTHSSMFGRSSISLLAFFLLGIAFTLSSVASGQRPCRFGQEPGVFWGQEYTPGMRFESAEPTCALVDYVSNDTKLLEQLSPKILWLSDSVDYGQLTTWCEKFMHGRLVTHERCIEPLDARRAKMGRVEDQRHTWSHVCHLEDGPYNRTKLMINWLVSVSRTGPYWAGVPVGSWVKVMDSKVAWDEISKYPPDMIVLATTLWDMGRLMLKYNHTRPNAMNYTHSQLDTFIREYTETVNVIRNVFPGVPILHRTHATPQPLAGPGRMRLGTLVQFHQLNAAAMHAANILGLDVWVWDSTFHQVYERSTLFLDDIHMQEWLTPDIFNIYFNYAAYHRSVRRRREASASEPMRQRVRQRA